MRTYSIREIMADILEGKMKHTASFQLGETCQVAKWEAAECSQEDIRKKSGGTLEMGMGFPKSSLGSASRYLSLLTCWLNLAETLVSHL